MTTMKSMSRVQSMVSFLAFVGAAVLSGGCGGGGGGNGGGGQADGRAALYSAIDAQLLTLTGTDKDAQNDQMLAFFKTRPELVESGIDESGVVWGNLADDTTIAVINNLNVSFPSSLTRSPARKASRRRSREGGIPDTARVIIGSTVGNMYDGWTDGIRTMFGDQTYEFAAPKSTVDELKNMSDISLLYFLGHGGTVSRPRGAGKSYCVWTETIRTAALDAAYAADLRDGSLVLMWAPVFVGTELNPVNTPVYEQRYGITSKFVEKYWVGKFNKDSLIFMNTCNSSSDDAIPFKFACLNAGASLYLGWTHKMILGDGMMTAAYLFDRLLGANNEDPFSSKTDLTIPMETPPQRAWNYADILLEMALHQRPDAAYAFDATVSTEKGGGKIASQLELLPRNDNFGQFAPSISFISLLEQTDELEINGVFGPKPGVVHLGASDLTVKTWTPELITCALPRSASGNLSVQINEGRQKSNTVQITSWKGPMTLTDTRQGTLKMVLNLNLHFRSCVNSSRSEPHGEPFESDGGYRHGLDSTGTYAFSGKYVTPDNGNGHWEETWSGAGTLVPVINADNNAGTTSHFAFFGGFLPDRHWRFDISARPFQGKHVHKVFFDKFGTVTQVVDTDEDHQWNSASNFNSPYLQIVPESYDIQPGSWTKVVSPEFVMTMEWGAFAVEASPDPKAARSARLRARR
jgi:hypothetical protein